MHLKIFTNIDRDLTLIGFPGTANQMKPLMRFIKINFVLKKKLFTKLFSKYRQHVVFRRLSGK